MFKYLDPDQLVKLEFVKSENYSPVSSVITMIKVGNHEVFPGQKLIAGTTITVYFGEPTQPSVDSLKSIDSTIIE